MPKISIVIRTYFRPHTLSGVLESIAKLDYPRDLMEVLVVADPEDSGAENVAGSFSNGNSGFSLKYIKCSVNSASACRNLGILESSGSMVAIVDDDVYVDVSALKRAVEHLEKDHDVACVCYPVISTSPSLGEKLHHWRFLGTVSTHVYTVFPITICWRDILVRVGLYREDMGPPLGLHEDWELGSRLRARGYRILIDGTLRNLHMLHMREERNPSRRRGGLAEYLRGYMTKHWRTFFEVMKVSPLNQKVEYLFYFIFPISALFILWLAGAAYFIAFLSIVFSSATLNSFLRGYYSRLRFVERIVYPSMLFAIRVLRTYLSVACLASHSVRRMLG